MRVALLSHSAPAGDAIGRQAAEKVAFFADRGADVRLFVTSDRRLHPGLRPYTSRFTPARPDGPLWRFIRSSDLVIVEYSQHFPLLDLLPLLAGGKAKVLFDYHGVTPPQFGASNHRDALERGQRLRGLVWYADAALVHSRFIANELRAATDYPAADVHALGYPLDVSWFAPGPVARALRPQLGLDADTQVLLFVGRLAPNKRVPLLVEAVARLRDLAPAVHAVIVGDGSDCYAAERQRCRERAARLGVVDRIHFLGQLDEAGLRDAYRDADVLVMPSVHEGFCIPVVEAMACGLPVVAARAAALPETVGDAALTFTADDADDLARQVRRVIELRDVQPAAKGDGGEGVASDVPHPSPRTAPARVAVVTPRYGHGFVGGAESSLRTLAESLYRAGHDVEVFTTCAGNGHVADNQLPERSASQERFAVHRYFTNPADAGRYTRAAAAIRQAEDDFDADEEFAFLQNSLRSTRLLDALRTRGPFDAIFVGPYLLGLTADVARTFPEQTILLPCFHDEPFARLPALRAAYEAVGGILYHSSEERGFAEGDLGVNHPNAHVLGTRIDVETRGDAPRGRERVGSGRRYLLYCGRYHREKGVPDLLAFAARYAAANPDRFTFAFAGMGDIAIPREPWARDLGYVTDEVRRDLMAGADAVVLLSANESLSLVTLEAHAQGTPAILRSGNTVLEGHIARGGGGRAVEGYETFAAALDDLWANPEVWQALGRRGQQYVWREFGDPAAYAARWQSALDGLDVPLSERLRANGLKRAAAIDRSGWREQFARVIETVLDAPPRPVQPLLCIQPRVAGIEGAVDSRTTLIPVRLVNNGRHPEAAEGPARTMLLSRTLTDDGRQVGEDVETPLPGLLLPGQDIAAAVRAGVPTVPGQYTIQVCVRRDGQEPQPAVEVALRVTATVAGPATPPAIPAALRPVLLAADAAQRLPDDYTDVSEGRFAGMKRWIKRKLLHNFQHAYVNVLSRQQSSFNRQVLNALAELGDAQATLAHTAVPADDGPLRAELGDLRRRYRRLARRLARVEAARPTPRPRTQETAP